MTLHIGEHIIEIDRFHESIERDSAITLNASSTMTVTPETIFPGLTGLVDNDFETIYVVNSDGLTIPLQKDYHVVNMISVNYDDSVKTYTVNIIIS